MKRKILTALRRRDGYVSGQELCDQLAVSRTAVWKVINQLREEGYEIESTPRKGYRILKEPDCITAEEVGSRFSERLSDWKIVYFDQIDSTNNEAKRRAEAGEKGRVLLIGEEQTAGKGRRGRTWVTPPKTAVAMSLLLHPQVKPERASAVTLVMGLAAAGAIRSFCGVDAKIKWPNDIVADGKKLCGILTEMSSEIDYINYLVIGIGINANVECFPEELKDTASSLMLQTGHRVDRAGLIAALMEAFEEAYDKFLKTQDLSLLMEEYNALLAGRDDRVRVLEPSGAYVGISRGIDVHGDLLVERGDGTTEAVYAGEVSVRGIYGYV